MLLCRGDQIWFTGTMAFQWPGDTGPYRATVVDELVTKWGNDYVVTGYAITVYPNKNYRHTGVKVPVSDVEPIG